MINAWDTFAVRVGDSLLSWALMPQRDAGLVVLGLTSACMLVVLRLVTTNRERLGVISGDERRLRDLRRAARREDDCERLSRLRNVRRLVTWQRARAEWKYLVAAACLLTTVLSWGTVRLEYLPVRDGSPVQLVARVSAASVNDVAHLVPQPGVTALNGWIQPVDSPRVHNSAENGEFSAAWRLTFDGSDAPRMLVVCFRDQNLEHPVLADGMRYESPVRVHPAGIETELLLKAYEPLGLLPSRAAGLPSWALVLSVVIAGGYFALRRLCGIP